MLLGCMMILCKRSGLVEFLDALPGESVDLIFADPPYNLSNDGYTCHEGRQHDNVNRGHRDRSWGIQANFDFNQHWMAAYHTHLQPGKEQRVGTGRKTFKCQGRNYPFRTPVEEPCRTVQCEWNRVHDGTDVADVRSALRAREASFSENKGPAPTASPATSTHRNVVEKPTEDTA